MLVLMALITTFMTSPLLDWVYIMPLRRQARLSAETPTGVSTLPPS
jgi:hypothetical protein